MFQQAPDSNKIVNVELFYLSYLYHIGYQKYGSFWSSLKLFFNFCRTDIVLLYALLPTCGFPLLVAFIYNIKKDMPCLNLYIPWISIYS